MDCFQDFCLNCDRQAAGGLYCSQSCRLADLEKANSPSSPTSMSTPSRSVPLNNRSPQPFILSSKPNDWTRTYTPPSSNEDRNSQMSYFMRTSAHASTRPASQGDRDRRALTPSSSRSSLSSNSGSSTHISEQAKQELQEYYNALDHAKASSKRRQSTW